MGNTQDKELQAFQDNVPTFNNVARIVHILVHGAGSQKDLDFLNSLKIKGYAEKLCDRFHLYWPSIAPDMLKPEYVWNCKEAHQLEGSILGTLARERPDATAINPVMRRFNNMPVPYQVEGIDPRSRDLKQEGEDMMAGKNDTPAEKAMGAIANVAMEGMKMAPGPLGWMASAADALPKVIDYFDPRPDHNDVLHQKVMGYDDNYADGVDPNAPIEPTDAEKALARHNRHKGKNVMLGDHEAAADLSARAPPDTTGEDASGASAASSASSGPSLPPSAAAIDPSAMPTYPPSAASAWGGAFASEFPHLYA